MEGEFAKRSLLRTFYGGGKVDKKRHVLFLESISTWPIWFWSRRMILQFYSFMLGLTLVAKSKVLPFEKNILHPNDFF